MIDESLQTPERIRTLQRKLYRKAKEEPSYRFYLLYDKIWRWDILAYAYVRARANQGAPGVDGETFDQIGSQGVVKGLEGPAGGASRHDVPGPGGANRRQAGAGADL